MSIFQRTPIAAAVLLPFSLSWAQVVYHQIVPTSQDQGQTWKYTTSAPPDDWAVPGFNDGAWQSGPGGFGVGNELMQTEWRTNDIWLRKHFNPGNLTAEEKKLLVFTVLHDGGVDLYINGVPAGEAPWVTNDYQAYPLTQEARDAIVSGGDNVIAVHARQEGGGGPYVDVGLVLPMVDNSRNVALLAPNLPSIRRLVFTRHYDLGGSHYAYTEGQSDAEAERSFVAGSSLCLFETDESYNFKVTTLLEDPQGVIRDPDVSYDGRCILFAWKKSNWQDDYHLYEMDAETRAVRQLTFGEGVADYEGAYLPNGDIVFSSTRPVQIVDCFFTEVSNLYMMDGDGNYMRRVGFDQVHTNYPKVTSDGMVTYTRWEYNDRGQVFPQGLFQMYPNGMGQTEYYGNNSWFPTSILHARGIPGTGKVICVLAGHHTIQIGKLAVIDPSRGRQETSGVEFVAPPGKPTGDIRIDKWGQGGVTWTHPWPIDEDNYIVSCRPVGFLHYGIYLMNRSGDMQLLVSDVEVSCNQPVPLMARPVPAIAAPKVDYTKTTGVYTMEKISIGPGLDGVAPGTVKKLRVVALRYQASGIGHNNNGGPAGGATVSTPIGINNASWDVKAILGETPVYDDGSAAFIVPARTPVYFQAIDAEGHVVQTMRSWSTMQPGEIFSCVGCHEDKNEAVPVGGLSLAMQKGPQPLEPFHDITGVGFSFPKIIQPILDAKCLSCHAGANGIDLRGDPVRDGTVQKSWNRAYLSLVQPYQENGNEVHSKYVSWLSPQSVPPMIPPYIAGSHQSLLVELLQNGHEGVALTRAELDKISAWIDLLIPHSGEYWEGMNDVEKSDYLIKQAKREDLEAEEAGNIEAYIEHLSSVQKDPPARDALLKINSFFLKVKGTDAPIHWNVPNHTGLKSVEIINTRGRTVRNLTVSGSAASWDGKDTAGVPVRPGFYMARLTAGPFRQVKKLMLIH